MPDNSLKGLSELSKKLTKLGTKLGGKTLRQSAMLATTPVIKALKGAAPRGKEAHRTYKGRLVAPGFLSRSVKRRSTYRNGVARVEIGVKKEAHYGLTFVERGTRPHDIPKQGRRKPGTGSWRKRSLKFGGRYYSRVRHPGTPAKPWFKKTFVAARYKITKRLVEQLSKKIERVAK